MTANVCGKAMRLTVHDSVVVGGASVGACENECLPTMTVCEEHATPDAVRMLAQHLSKELETALLCARVEAHNFDEARAQLKRLRGTVAAFRAARECVDKIDAFDDESELDAALGIEQETMEAMFAAADEASLG